MKVFYSKMADDIKGMIELKVVTNHRENTYLSRSRVFDLFCRESFPEETVVSETLALSWIKEALDNHTGNVAHSRVSYLRMLAQYQKAIGKKPYIPPKGMLNGKTLFVPYIFTDGELKDLFHAIDMGQKGSAFERLLSSTYFRLTYTCGLRPIEGRILRRSDVDLKTGEVRIVNSKWNKSRTIVMSDDMCQLAKSYVNHRDLKYPESEYFFPAPDGGCYAAGQMQTRFRRFYELSRPDISKELLPAVRVYDLRHRFATAHLSKWIDEKVNLNARLPYLQTFMGHKEIASTAYYIHLLPENLKRSSGINWKHLDTLVPEVEQWEER